MIDLDSLKASGLNGDTHAALLLERHRCTQRMELLLELVRKERADLALINGEIAACERAAMEASSEFDDTRSGDVDAWLQYEAAKLKYCKEHPDATEAEYDAFINSIAPTDPRRASS